MSLNRNILINRIKERMIVREDDVTTSGGEQTKVYLDIPGVLRDKATLNLAAYVLYEHLVNQKVLNMSGPDMIGGPLTGSIPLVMGLAQIHHNDETEWFIIRDTPKTHGLGRWFVGGEPGEGDKVILTDDVVSTGASLIEAAHRIAVAGAEVVAVVPLVDRGNVAAERFEKVNLPYLPVLTYADLDLPPLGA